MADKHAPGLPRASASFETMQMPPAKPNSASTSSTPPSHQSSISFSSFTSFRPHNPPSTMASQSHTTQPAYIPVAASAAKETKKVDISSLMSPPDPLLDSFNLDTYSKRNGAMGVVHSKGPAPVAGQPALAMKQPLPMSPPVSPYSKPVTTPSDAARSPSGPVNEDPVLYPPEEEATPSPPQPPLFAVAELEDHRRIVDDHVRARSASIFGGVSPPRREDYELVLTFRSQVMKHVMKNRNTWLRKERAFLEADKRAGAHRYHTIMPAKPIAAKLPRQQRTDRITKPTGAVGTLSTAPRPIRSNGNGPISGKRSASRTSPTPEPSRRAVAPNREDKDFNSLPDYCPPLSSLPSRPNSLKVEWKGQPIDLSGDPQAHLLHPDEVALAGNLRLDCATYLTSKRRIFERRLQCLRTGKEFRKTDAQQACKIDVNKASKLWTAFDRVGWLDAHWVRRYL